jgi:hypothetical protein
MSLGGFAVGLLLLVFALGCAVYSGIRLTEVRVAHLRGVERALAAALITTCAFALSVLLPAMLGILTRGTQVAFAGMLTALVVVLPRRAQAAETAPAAERWRSPEAGLVAVAALALLAWMAAELLHAGAAVTTSTDTISYDLPVIGRWIQSGSIWPVTELFPLQTHGTYPQTANLILAGFILPFHNDAFARLPPTPFCC